MAKTIDNLILIVGRSATGKDTLAQALADEGLSVVKSRTTRPQRPGEEDSHLFLKDTDWERERDEACAVTVIGDYHYWVIPDDLKGKQVYVTGPNAVDSVCSALPDMRFDLIHMLAADDNSRMQMALVRAGSSDEAKQEVESRQSDEDAMFSEFESRVDSYRNGDFSVFPDQVASVSEFRNDYQPQTIAEICANVILMRRLRNNMLRIVNDCAWTFGDLMTNGSDRICTMASDGSYVMRTAEEIAQTCCDDPLTIGTLCQAWLRHLDLTKMEELPKYTDDMIFEQGQSAI